LEDVVIEIALKTVQETRFKSRIGKVIFVCAAIHTANFG